MSSKTASNHHIVLSQDNSLSITGLRPHDKFSSLSPSVVRTLPQCPVLVTEPALHLSLYVLPRHPQGQLRSDSLVNRTLSSELNLMECRVNMCV